MKYILQFVFNLYGALLIQMFYKAVNPNYTEFKNDMVLWLSIIFMGTISMVIFFKNNIK